MHQTVERALPDIAALCRSLGIRNLDLFGSATGADFDMDHSDVDVLVEFDLAQQHGRFDTYFALKEGLEVILGRPVDVVSADAVRNPYLRSRIAEQRERLYAA